MRIGKDAACLIKMGFFSLLAYPLFYYPVDYSAPKRDIPLNPRPCTPIFITRTCKGGGSMRPPPRAFRN